MSEDEATSTRAHLSVDDNRIIVSWMEDKKNFDAIHGSGGKTSVGGMPKRSAFRMMAEHLNLRTQNEALSKLSGRNMQQRWKPICVDSKRR
ncbi:hypothetical protein PC116_g4592 [Phytophthora cactorum]|uniref:Uncharacterized protein n=1 Tax=Phytophthora cactorum TaxID=29920 RepID=A0A8T0ZXM4_9STRA|nr:hypothetical protein GQ600_163 [Phytophthora cactorum]KAG2762130.1 hypothetical protein Pcac1_g26106 [Phytophthora cactorum]KAG2843671.1 hypothetical protein PC112_g2507 [Phytophthora cactorum]KAG2866869.1 hypothetical protein PC113_g2474 [Phytophthora cactorum]KAG2927864.1 hypothetical protein PC114_g3323 [Phytophthora cactorum]